MKNVIVNCKTMESYSSTKLKRTSFSFDPFLWELACAYFGSAEQVRDHLRQSALNGPWNSSAAQRNLLSLVAKPSLIKRVESDLELQTDLEDF